MPKRVMEGSSGKTDKLITNLTLLVAAIFHY
jgi:hypothetical protein